MYPCIHVSHILIFYLLTFFRKTYLKLRKIKLIQNYCMWIYGNSEEPFSELRNEIVALLSLQLQSYFQCQICETEFSDTEYLEISTFLISSH
jgi:hypothetical protein